MARVLLVALALGGASNVGLATTWAETQVTCPLCGTANAFNSIMSYGTYIYNWPSKFQYIFWPLTVGNSLYCCKKCCLTAFLGDFRRVPEPKKEELRKQLAGVKLDKEYASYTDIPMVTRLGIAERVYSVLGQDDEFWCQFYRVLGYHLGVAGKSEEAAAARKKALGLARKMAENKDNAGLRKELLLISGAMSHFLGDNKGALADLKEAAGLTYENKKLKADDTKGLDQYLSGLLKEYIALVEKGAKPKEAGERDND